MSTGDKTNFFISYTSADKLWAEWVAWQLERAGYTTVIQAWDFIAGDSFTDKMRKGAAQAEHTIAIYSPDYFRSDIAQSELHAAFSQDPLGKQSKLIPVRVCDVEIDPLLSNIVYIDLVGRNEDESIDALLKGVKRDRMKPREAPLFPGGSKDAPVFPGSMEPIKAKDSARDISFISKIIGAIIFIIVVLIVMNLVIDKLIRDGQPVEETSEPVVSETVDDRAIEDQEAVQVLEPCIRAGTDYWQSTWLGTTEETKPRSRSSANLNCYDFIYQGFSAIAIENENEYGLRIACGSGVSECDIENSAAGIFAQVVDGEYEFIISIDRIEITKQSSESEPSDVDFVIGVGDPIIGSGNVVIFRLINVSGNIHFCSGSSLSIYCDPISKVGPDLFGKRVVKISISEATEIFLDGTKIAQVDLEDPLNRTLWIGYNFRSEGILIATIQFPESLSYLLSIE